MKPRDMFLTLVAAVVILGVQFAWWSAQPVRPVQSYFQSPAGAPLVVTRTGEVIPAANVSVASDSPAPGAAVATAVPVSATGTPTRPPRVNSRSEQVNTGAGSPARATALVEANKVRHMITDYHTLMGQNPVGTNAEIMTALMGGNPHQATLGPPEGQSLNGQGELVDQWGTPYFFHQLSRDRMEIYSAGPDKIMGTADDVVVR